MVGHADIKGAGLTFGAVFVGLAAPWHRDALGVDADLSQLAIDVLLARGLLEALGERADLALLAVVVVFADRCAADPPVALLPFTAIPVVGTASDVDAMAQHAGSAIRAVVVPNALVHGAAELPVADLAVDAPIIVYALHQPHAVPSITPLGVPTVEVVEARVEGDADVVDALLVLFAVVFLDALPDDADAVADLAFVAVLVAVARPGPHAHAGVADLAFTAVLVATAATWVDAVPQDADLAVPALVVPGAASARSASTIHTDLTVSALFVPLTGDEVHAITRDAPLLVPAVEIVQADVEWDADVFEALLVVVTIRPLHAVPHDAEARSADLALLAVTTVVAVVAFPVRHTVAREAELAFQAIVC